MLVKIVANQKHLLLLHHLMMTSWLVKHIVIINKELKRYTFVELRRRNTAIRLVITQRDALYKDRRLSLKRSTKVLFLPVIRLKEKYGLFVTATVLLLVNNSINNYCILYRSELSSDGLCRSHDPRMQ
jgi:hypothetical protein